MAKHDGTQNGRPTPTGNVPGLSRMKLDRNLAEQQESQSSSPRNRLYHST